MLLARTHGTIEWICPDCARLNRSRVDRRWARVRCPHLGCHRVFLVGIHFRPRLTGLPPFNSAFLPTAADRLTHNVHGDLPEAHLALIGRVSGPVEWLCPDCAEPHFDYPEWGPSRLYCRCGLERFVSLVLMRPSFHAKRTPHDWISDVSLDFSHHQRLGALGDRRRRLGSPHGRRSGPPASIGGSASSDVLRKHDENRPEGAPRAS